METPTQIELQDADTLENPDDKQDSGFVLDALQDAAKVFKPWQDLCNRIDDTWGRTRELNDATDWADDDLDVFWASTEILKPAIYSRPPVPVVSTRFSIRDQFLDTASEMLERVIITTLSQTGIDDVMRGLCDDLIMAARGVAWVRLDDDGDHPRVVVEHLDRTDFLHEPARKWPEVGWVARCAWMTADEMRERFGDKREGDGQYVWEAAAFSERETRKGEGPHDNSKQAAVWEVWHRKDKRVYWVTEGVDVLLDSDDAPYDLETFWPCPKPVYGSTRRRSLHPIPDFVRYQSHLEKINDLTSRIYGLLDSIRVKGLIPSGSEVGDAVQIALRENDDDSMFIPVPAAAFVGNGQEPIQFLPVDMFAQTVQGLIASRQQLMQDFYQLSGISDIMRGATDAQETLGAQQLKSQYGSIRVRDKVDALIACAKEICGIVGEIIAEEFDADDLAAMSMMKLPRDKDIKAQIKQIQQQAVDADKHLAGMQAQLQAQVQPPMPPQQVAPQ